MKTVVLYDRTGLRRVIELDFILERGDCLHIDGQVVSILNCTVSVYPLPLKDQYSIKALEYECDKVPFPPEKTVP